jgi:hypothetical protein
LLPAPWRDGELLTAIADAWSELGHFDKAIENYRAAILRRDPVQPSDPSSSLPTSKSDTRSVCSRLAQSLQSPPFRKRPGRRPPILSSS